MSSECVVCGDRGGVGIGGVLLCALHAAAYQEWATAERAAGRPTDVAKWALRERRDVATTIRLSPAALRLADRLAADRGLSRGKLIEALVTAQKEEGE